MITTLNSPKKITSNSRISLKKGLDLFKNAPLLELAEQAQKIRFQKNPQKTVTYVIDTNPNYTNICVTDCSFCAFYRKPGHSQGYTLSVDQVLEKIKQSSDIGVTTVLLQGGHNPDLPLSYYLEIIKRTRKEFPHITPHFFSASEIQHIAKFSKTTLQNVLQQFKDAGIISIPGAGAEVLSEQVRKRIANKKGGPEKWLEVHRKAHKIGIRTTATMMYGHIDQPEDILEHLENIRNLQDKTHGFTAFIPWSYKPNNTPLQKKVPHKSLPNDYLRIIAFSRIYLDNFDHIQATWFSEGKKTGQLALHMGADDFGGTIYEENVHAATHHIHKATLEEIQTLIQESGFQPAQRDTLYNRI